MDSLNYGLVAEKLGVTLKNIAQNTAAIIIDGQVFRVDTLTTNEKTVSFKTHCHSLLPFQFQDESSYVLKETLTTANLIDFVYNYTTNKLARHLRNDRNVKHSHFYRPINSQSDENYCPGVEEKHLSKKFDFIEVATLSAQNFTDFVSESHRVSFS